MPAGLLLETIQCLKAQNPVNYIDSVSDNIDSVSGFLIIFIMI